MSALYGLFTNRVLDATSLTMVLNRSGAGHRILYLYIEDKETIAVAAIEQMHANVMVKLGLDTGDAEGSESIDINAAHSGCSSPIEGCALFHLLTDPGVSESPVLCT